LIVPGEMDLKNFIETLSEMEIEGAEILESHFDEVTAYAVRNLVIHAQSVNVEIPAIALENDFAYTKPEKRAVEIRKMKNWIRIASMAEVPYLRVFTGDQKPGVDYETQVGWVTEAFQECAKLAEDEGVYLVIENHSEICRTAEELFALIEKISSSNVRVCLDAHNFNSEYSDIVYEGAERLLPYTIYSHVKFLDFNGRYFPHILDYERLLSIYKKYGYDGYLSIEYAGSSSPMAAVGEACRLLKETLTCIEG